MSLRPDRVRRLCVALLGAALLGTSSATCAQEAIPDDNRFPAAPMHEEVLGLAGDPSRPVTLQVTLFTPSGPGPFPLALVNHGATNVSAANRGERYRFTVLAYYFLSRGYAVAMPMMRGFAGSGGMIPHAGCDLAAVADADARDIRAVAEALARRPGIDASRTVVAGQSFGAWNTLGVGASPPAGARALVSFNAAIRTSDCQAQDSSMAAAAGQLAARTVLPSLWFYGDNDTVMPIATWRAVYDRYKAGSARAELVAFGPYGSDSHQLLSDPGSLPFWAPKLDAFLARAGLPSGATHPEYLPHQAPLATRWAPLQDVRAVPLLNDDGRTLYQKFLGAPRPRAFVISPNGSAGQFSGGYDPLGRALLACGRSGGGCRPYAVNDDVVWSGPHQGEGQGTGPVRVVAKTVRMGAITPLGAFYSVNPDCSSRGLPRVVIMERPTHGVATVARQDERASFPAASPYAACNASVVPAMGVTYAPVPGYSGTDALVIDETAPDGRHQVIRLELRVM